MQEKIVKEFFDGISDDWYDRAYDPDNKFLTYPTSKVREDIILNELWRYVSTPVLDVGCGIGILVNELERRGVTTFGLDNSPKMIDIASKGVKHRFFCEDLFKHKGIYNTIIAMGVVEYIKDTRG